MQESNKIEDYLKETGEACSCASYVERLRGKVKEITGRSAFTSQLAYHKVLANHARLTIFKLLEEHPLCTCALAEILDMSEGNASHHLKKLEREGLIFGKKTGRFTTYYTKERLIELLSGKE